MKTKTQRTIALTLALLASASVWLPAQSVQIDLQQTGGATETGWLGWDLSGSFSSTAQVNSFSYSETTDGDLDVSLTPASNAGARMYGLGAVTDPGNLTIPDVWADQYFFNNNAPGTLTVRLDDLKAGTYQFTSYHFANILNGALPSNDEGTAPVSIDTGGGAVATGEEVHFVAGTASQVATSGAGVLASELDTFGTFTATLVVANDDDPVDIIYGPLSSGDSFGLNGIVLELVPPDTTPPVLLPPTSPADGAVDVLVFSNLVATFDEPIDLEAGGTITLRDLGPGPDLEITLPDPAQVSVSGATLTIDPAADLVAGNDYAVQISGDAVKDLAAAPNFFAGITDDTTWNFTTNSDGTPPSLSLTTPADEATDVDTGTNLVATFDDTILAGTGNITVRNITAGTDWILPIGDGQVSIFGSGLTINPDTDLDPGDDYAIRIEAGAVTDAVGNPFAGIDDDTTWNFTTAPDLTDPTLTDTSPANGATAVSDTANLVATFSEPIVAGSGVLLLDADFEGGAGGFTVKVTGQTGSTWEHGVPDSSGPGGTIDGGNPGSPLGCWGTNLGLTDDGFYVVPTVTCLRSPVIDLTSVTSATLTFAEALDLELDDTAVVNIIDDTSDTVIAAAIYTASDANTLAADWNPTQAIDLAAGIGQMVRIEWCFEGPDGGDNDDYMGWYVDDVLVTGLTAANSITIRNLTDTTETVIPVGDPRILFSGNTLVINPGTNLASTTDYAVRIGSAVVADPSGNPFSGLGDDTTWAFTTRDVADTVFVDLQSDGTNTADAPTQSGWNAWELSESFSPGTRSTTFTYAQTTDGTVDVSLITTTNAGGRNYELDSLVDPGNLTDSDVWFDQFFFNNNTAGTLTLRLEDLTAGTYAITTYHYADNLDPNPAGTNDSGTADISVNGVDTGLDAVFLSGANGTLERTAVEIKTSARTIQFTVANDGDTVDILFDGLAENATGDSFGLNGFEVWRTGDVGTGNNFSDWIAGFPVGGETGIDDDPDGDGVDNGVENYFGTPADLFSQGLVAGAADAGANTFTFTHPLNDTPADDLSATYRWSTDLQTFHDDGDSNGAGTTTVSFAPGTPSGGMVTVTATISGTVIPDKVFVDVEVTQSPG